MATVIYSGSTIVPAPLYSLDQKIRRTGDGTPISVEYNITLTGHLVACKGSPNSAGQYGVSLEDDTCLTADSKFESIIKKQAAVRELFENEGRKLEITSDSGITFYCHPRAESVSFSPEVNVEKNAYTIVLVAHELISDNHSADYPASIVTALRYNLESVSESFDLSKTKDYDENGLESPIFNVSHSVSAKSYKTYDGSTSTLPGPHDTDEEGLGNQGYINARTFVQSRVEESGISDTSVLYSLINSSEYFDGTEKEAYGDYVISDDAITENGDYFEGTYGITRTLKLVKKAGNTGDKKYLARHEYTVEATRNRPKSDSDLGYENIYTVNGSVQGLIGEDGTTIVSAYDNAKLFYNEYIQDKSAGYEIIIGKITDIITPAPNLGTTHAIPTSTNVSHNKKTGTIGYSFTFKENVATSNPSAGQYFADFSLKMSDRHDNTNVAIIPILGRVLGPIVQVLNTTDVIRRTISGNFMLKNTGTGLLGGNPWATSDINTLREEAIKIMQNKPSKCLPATGYNEDYFVEDWTDSLDVYSGTYDMALTVIFKRTAAAESPTSSGWELPGV